MIRNTMFDLDLETSNVVRLVSWKIDSNSMPDAELICNYRSGLGRAYRLSLISNHIMEFHGNSTRCGLHSAHVTQTVNQC
jgi:hypothetical protein